LSRTIFISLPSSTIVLSELCAELGPDRFNRFSMSDNLVRPMICSCASVGSEFHPDQIVKVFLPL